MSLKTFSDLTEFFSSNFPLLERLEHVRQYDIRIDHAVRVYHEQLWLVVDWNFTKFDIQTILKDVLENLFILF